MIQIRIQPTADMVHSLVADTDDQETMALWHGREVPEVAARRLDVLVERAESLIRERWPADEIQLTVSGEQLGCGGATRPLVYAVDHDHDEDPQEALEEIGGRAWMAACEAEIAACECGRATGTACAWQGRAGELVAIEWMPEYLRESHQRAGNMGVWPHNGAMLLRVSPSCAEAFEREEPEWTRRRAQVGE